ncbi:hypothetical protein [Azospirillum palustre]|uniref:hypothetical protein n=1 Tax=Azospirillum palustre TaxID=2044885 RepID=UPI001178B9B1|nr:hypothetical protein [Azospirillum palustre]
MTDTNLPYLSGAALSPSIADKQDRKPVTARDMLARPGFRERISEKQPNHFENHNRALAESQLEARLAALYQCTDQPD